MAQAGRPYVWLIGCCIGRVGSGERLGLGGSMVRVHVTQNVVQDVRVHAVHRCIGTIGAVRISACQTDHLRTFLHPLLPPSLPFVQYNAIKGLPSRGAPPPVPAYKLSASDTYQRKENERENGQKHFPQLPSGDG